MRYVTSFLAVVSLLIVPFFAFGQADFGTEYLSGVGLGTQDIRVTIVRIIRVALGILGTITLVLIVYAGFIWMTSGGKQETIAKAKKIIINAVIGLLIIILAAAITEFIFRQIQTATTPTTGPNTCAPENSCVADCTYCNASGIKVFDKNCGTCGLGFNQFELRSVQTAHNGSDPKKDVYLCSQVQPRFNNNVDSTTVVGNARVTDLAGVEVDGTWVTSGNVIHFTPNNNFAPNRDYEVRLTSALADASGDYLASCNGTTCESNPPIFSYYGWQFKTGVDTDTKPPYVTKAFPKLDNTSRTVSRLPVIDVTFSEDINFLSIADSNTPPHPQIDKFILQAIDGPGGGPVGPVIDNNNLIVTAKDDGFRIKIDTDSGLLLDGFTWYRITVNDIVDLCANNQQPTPEVWEFQTNDNVPGVVSYSPTGNNSCPDTTILFTFGTSMHDELIVLDIDGQFITIQPTEFDLVTTVSGLGTLSVLDPSFSPDPPNGNYRNFEFIPANPLITGQTYNVNVSAPNMVIDGDGNTISESWQFGIGSADSCTCSPYITRLSPSQGSVGQCMTIQGRCFSGTSDSKGSLSAVRFIDQFNNSTGAAIGGQAENFVTTDVPSSLGPDLYNVEVDLTYNDTNYGTITSNQRQFLVDAGPAYNGPCLYVIEPNQACHGSNISLKGIRLGEDPGIGNRSTGMDNINFSANGRVPDSDVVSWEDDVIQFNLTNGFQDSDVMITANGVISNSLPFDVSCGAGSWCSSSAAPICTPNDIQCSSGICNATSCLCESGNGSGTNKFRIVDRWPDCNTACPNSSLGVSFSKDVDGSQIDNNSLLVFKCLDGNSCQNLSNVTKTWNVTGSNLDINAGTLSADMYYRVVITDEVTDTTGLFLGGLNYDVDGDGNNDAYSWVFKTDIDECDITGVDIVPDNMSFTALDVSKKITGRAMSDQGCFGNQPIINNGLNWFWTQKNAAIAAVTYEDLDGNGLTDPSQNVFSRGLGVTGVVGNIQGLPFEDITNVTVDLAFDVQTVWPNCNTACPNSELGARFSSPVDISTIVNSSFGLYVCNDGSNCNVLTPASLTAQVTADDEVVIRPDNDLQLDIYYRAIIYDAVMGSNGESITNLNYDSDFDGNDDSYSWIFKTKDEVCTITSISSQPATMTFNSIGQNQNIVGKALTDQGCAGGQYLDSWDYNWDWNIGDNSIASLQSPLVDSDIDGNIDPLQPVTSESLGTTNIKGTASGFTSLSEIEVVGSNIAPTSCDSNTQTPACEPNSNKCSNINYCNPSSCSCEAPPAPNIISVFPSNNTVLECSNTAFNVLFDQPMKNTGNSFSLQFGNAESTKIPISVESYLVANGIDGCNWADGCTGFIISPLSAFTEALSLKLNINSEISSIYGQALGNNVSYNYTAGTAICQLDGVKILPSSWTFTSDVSPYNSTSFIAQAYSYSGGGVYISPIPNYSWDWNWTEEDPNDFINISPNTNTNDVTVAKRGQGDAYITGEATIATDNIYDGSHIGRSRDAVASIRIFICDYPWSDPPPYSIGYNATMEYCRGNEGDALLPNIVETANFPGDGALIRDTIFAVDEPAGLTGKDVIGLRVYKNPTHSSAAGWYSAQDFPQGSPSETTIDGYSAVIDGRTIYIHFTDINASDVSSYILVISYNQDASNTTKLIYDKLVNSLRFNRNISYTDKQNILEDMDRIGGLGFIIEKLVDYQDSHDGSLPDLSSGSFISGQSTSRWPQSWQAILGNAIGTRMPVDPDNTFNNCPEDYDQQSCFNVNLSPQFECPAGSHIYIYKNGKVYANPKYKNINWVGIGTVSGDDSCTSFGLDVNSSILDIIRSNENNSSL